MSGTVRIAACIVAAAAAGCAAKQHVTPGTPGSWLVASNTSVWYQPDGPDGGFGWEVLAGKAVLPNLIVGARGSALAVLKIRLFDDAEDTTQSSHLDVGPIIGTAAGWGRLSASAMSGPLATRITHDDQTRWTVGLGLDAGIAARIHGAVALGIHGFSNLNAQETAPTRPTRESSKPRVRSAALATTISRWPGTLPPRSRRS